MTALSDRADELLDLAAHALIEDRLDLLDYDTLRDVFQLAVEVLEPGLSDRDAKIAALEAEIASLRNKLAVHQGIATGLERVRMERATAGRLMAAIEEP